MPELSRFFGIIIRMFAELGAPHHRPHFHAAYQNATATFALDPIECIGGELPRTQQRLVEAWKCGRWWGAPSSANIRMMIPKKRDSSGTRSLSHAVGVRLSG